MKSMVWLLLAAFVVGSVWLVMRTRRKMQERESAEAERFASFMAATAAAKKPADSLDPAPVRPATAAIPLPAASMSMSIPVDGLVQQKLLFEAAHKAGEAGEPMLAVQLYARLLARFPATAFAPEARAAVEAQKKKLLKA